MASITANRPLDDTPASAPIGSAARLAMRFGRLLPGIGLCVLVTAAARLAEAVEHRLIGRAWLESLVLAILIGAAVRTVWTPHARWRGGINFCAKTVLEIAVVMLGASLSAATIMAAGPALLAGIVGVVAVAIGASYGLGRALGLPRRMAILVACGNSICGNSAIAAVAPVIGADSDDVATAIAFTAVLGVVAVLGLPVLAGVLHMSGLQYGVLAGLTVYAVPQVLAATAPLGAVALQVGTLVKLCRVLMLGPVCLVLSIVARRWREDSSPPLRSGGGGGAADGGGARRSGPLHHATRGPPPPLRRGGEAAHKLSLGDLVPWFILGFLALAAMRSLNLIPVRLLAPTASISSLLTVVSMAALGLGVDIRVVAKAGGPVTAAVCLSLLVLGLISLGLIHGLRLS
jgi:uncharacterized integral membrane protein (TIGR00698 family)